MGWTGRKCPACAGTGDEYENEEIDAKNVCYYSTLYLDQPYSGFSCLHLGPYKIGIAVTAENGTQDQEAAGKALEQFIVDARAALSR